MLDKNCFLIAALIAGAPVHLYSQPSLKITSPETGTVVHPGQTVVVDVVVNNGEAIAVTIAAQDPIRVSEFRTGPPYRFSVAIPLKITPRLYTLVAEGAAAASHLQSSDPVRIDVERNDDPLSVAPDLSFLEVPVGGWVGVHLMGIFSDGSRIDLSRSSKTTYTTSPPGVVSITSEGLVTGIATGKTTIEIRHGNQVAVVRAAVTQ